MGAVKVQENGIAAIRLEWTMEVAIVIIVDAVFKSNMGSPTVVRDAADVTNVDEAVVREIGDIISVWVKGSTNITLS